MVTNQAPTGTRLEDRLSRGLLAWRDRYVAWVRQHPRLVDAGLVAVLLLLSWQRIAGLRGSQLAWVLVIPALLLPLAWRRRSPFAVFGIIAVAAVVQSIEHEALAEDLALLIAFYTVVAYERPRRILAAAAILEAGSVLVAIRQGVHPAQLIAMWVFISALVVAAGLIGYYVRTRRAFLASLVGRAERLERERDREALLAASAERARIAREMHDIVAHNLAVMIALADGAAYTARADPGQAVAIMGQVSGTGRGALTEMRRLLGVMREPPALGDDTAAGTMAGAGAGVAGSAVAGSAVAGSAAGTAAAGPEHAPQPTLADVEDLLARVRAAGLPTALAVSGQPLALPPSMELALYRLIQEALTNTLKHAAATSAQVRLVYRPGEVELEVTDDGKPDSGPPDAAQPNAAQPNAGPGSPPGECSAGHGIVGMRERAAVFGGQVVVGPCSGGWRVHTVLPLDRAPAMSSGGAARPIPTL
jgi:signal transduction histidine kinase